VPAGISAPPGVALVESQTWFDNAVTITGTGGSLVANGPVTYNGSVSLGGTSANDYNEALSPSSLGLTAWDYPYIFATGTGSAVITGGSLYLMKLPLAGGTPITNLWFKIATAAVTPVSGQCFAGLYNANGALVATSADLASTISTNTGPIKAPLTSVYNSTGGNYWVGLSVNAATLPVLSCYTGFVTVTTSVATFGSATTFGNTAAKYPFAVSATTGNTTALPASITMASNTATGAYTAWVGAN
jgi:hypothetical protein